MKCNVVFYFPSTEPAIESSDLQAEVSKTISRHNLSQLRWLESGLSADSAALRQLGIYLDYRVIEQAETLLYTLAEAYPSLSATISSRYSPFRGHEAGSFNDDMGGVFRVTLQAGLVETEDTPIV